MVSSTIPVSSFTQIQQRLKTLSKVMTTPAPIAQTPKEMIWSLNKAKLYRYLPVVPKEKRHPVPLLLVFALMNRPYILDLSPGNSFVEFMVKSGYDVYLLDWGVPGLEDKHLKLDDYCLDYLPRAIRKLKAVSGSEEFSLLGWCIGAIVTSIYAAMRPESGLRNLLLLTAPLDFSNREALTFARWTDEKYFDIDKVLAAFGNMPGEMIDFGAKTLKPVENFIGSYLKLWDNLDDPRIVAAWHAMYTWVSNNIPMAGAAYRQLIVELYRNDRLMRGELMIKGERVDLGRIQANLLTVISQGDHITPPCQSEHILEKVGSKDKEIYWGRGGHIGIMTGSNASKCTWPHINNWLGTRSS